MRYANAMIFVALMAAASAAGAPAQAQDKNDLSKYPDWSGQWLRIGGIQWDPSKPLGAGQKPPLTPEYQAVFDASLADQSHGGQGNNARFTCIPHGMPRTMTATFPFEIIIQPKTTYILFENQPDRRIYTDGRDWPKNLEPAFAGYSIGHWVEDGGRFNGLEVETRNMKGPRDFETSGLPVHEDNQTVVMEKLYLDQAKPDILHDEVTTIDHALTRPWTVTKSYRRERNPIWYDNNCAENNNHVVIGKENYFLSADGLLMPAKKDQPAPDLRYFKPSH
ncbi:MAG TPA: hypothetical protein VIY51_00240 [Xanthobacteraceae bacterium]